MDLKARVILAAAAALLLCVTVHADTCGDNNMMGSCTASVGCGWCVGLNMTSCVAGDATGPSSADHCCYAYSHQLTGELKEEQKCPEIVANKPALKTDGGSVVVGAMDDVVFEITGQRPISISGLDMRVDEAKKLVMDTDANTVIAIANAKQEAIDSAATDATSKAAKAKQEAIDAAATNATTKAATAKQEAIDDAAADATTKAATAKQDAINAAATDATTKANTARADAMTYTDDAIDDLVDTSRVLNGTLEAQVDLLMESHAQALRDIASLRAVVTELEDIGVFPTSCKDLYANMVARGVNNIPSQVYPIYPLGNAASRINAFCEMHLHDISFVGSENLALGKDTWQTTTTNSAPSSRLVDGNPSGAWSSGSCNHGESGETDAVWRVDLGDFYQINRVVITNRQDCCGDRLNNFEIRLGRKWDESLGRSDPECRPGELLQQSRKFTVQCSNLVDARYLSIHLPGPGRTLNLCEVEVYGTEAKNPGGWTLIASGKAGESYPDNLKTLYGTTPKAGEFGVLEYFFTNDLKTLGTELYVENEAGESHFFQLDQFTGPVVVDSANMVDTASHGHFGLITGNDYPVVSHYQTGATCGTDEDCREPVGRAEQYSTGILFLLDWNFDDGNPELGGHASFGGTDGLATLWSHRGTMLYIR